MEQTARIAGARSLRSTHRVGALLAALALLLGPLLLGPRPAVAQPRARIAVLPIVVHSIESQSYLRAGLADMLAARLGSAPGVAVLRVDDPAKATTDPSTARAVAGALGAHYVLFGSFTRFGEGASLDVRCLPVTGGDAGDPRSIFIQSGSIGEIIPRLDELAEKVARYATGRAEPSSDVGAAPASRGARAELDAALAEIEALRRRVEELERRFGESPPLAGLPAPREPGAELR